MMCIAGCLWSQCKGNWPHLNLILGTLNNFEFLGTHQCSSRLVTVLLRTLWSSIKQIESPYVFDWENAISLDTVQGNRASSGREGKVSWVFSSCGRNLVYILELQREWIFETRVCSAKSGLLSSYDGHLRKLYSAWQENTDASADEPGGQASLISCHSYVGIPVNFHEESGIVTF